MNKLQNLQELQELVQRSKLNNLKLAELEFVRIFLRELSKHARTSIRFYDQVSTVAGMHFLDMTAWLSMDNHTSTIMTRNDQFRYVNREWVKARELCIVMIVEILNISIIRRQILTIIVIITSTCIFVRWTYRAWRNLKMILYLWIIVKVLILLVCMRHGKGITMILLILSTDIRILIPWDATGSNTSWLRWSYRFC